MINEVIFNKPHKMKKLILFTIILLISVNALPQELMTIGEVFDFEIGDKYQYEGNGLNQPPNADRISITDKFYSEENDTVFYVRYHDSYYTIIENYELVYYFWTDTDTIFYTNLDTCITTYNWKPYDTSMVYYDTLIFNSAEHCDSLVNGYSCQMFSFEPVYYVRHYAKGLGMVKDFYDSPSAYSMMDNVLFYYEKNGIGCGTPDTLTVSINERQENNNYIIYPNPASVLITVEFSQAHQKALFQIMDMGGKVVLEKQLEINHQCINILSIPPGTYVYRIFNKDGLDEKGKIVVE